MRTEAGRLLALLSDHEIVDIADTGVFAMRRGRRRAPRRPANIPVPVTRSALSPGLVARPIDTLATSVTFKNQEIP